MIKSPFFTLPAEGGMDLTSRNQLKIDARRAKICSVAKISLWESQKSLIEKLFDWAEEEKFYWEWFITRYNASLNGISSREISFIFFLQKNEAEVFFSSLPSKFLAYVRMEPFDFQIYRYYKLSGRKGVLKHPKTP